MNSEKKLIFVVGNSRSGTTMMSRILGNNEDIYNLQEIHFFEWLVNPKSINDKISEKDAVSLLNKMFGQQLQNFYHQENLEQYTNLSREVLDSLNPGYTNVTVFKGFLFYFSLLHNKSIPCEQTPKNVFYIKELLNSFPECYIINMVRDPRAVMLSQKNKWKRRFYGEEGVTISETIRAWSLYHPLITSKIWKSSFNSALKYEGKDNVITIKYEDLLSSPEITLKILCDIIKIEYNSSMMEVPNVGSSLGIEEVKAGLDSSKINSWKNGSLSDTEIFICEKFLSSEMGISGYEYENRLPSIFSLIFEFSILVPKLVIAFIFNLSRMNGIYSAIKMRLRGSEQ